MQARASAAEDDQSTTGKKPRLADGEMPAADLNDDSTLFPLEEIVRSPLPGLVAPLSVSFSPDDRLVGYLYSPEGTLYRKVFAFDLAARRQDLVFGPPDGGGLDESNISAEEKLRRERSRERGLGVTRYEWRARMASGKHSIMVPLPSGVYFQDLYGSEPEIKLQSTADSPIIDPHLSPDGSTLAYVRDDELHALNLSSGEHNQLTFGARRNGKV